MRNTNHESIPSVEVDVDRFENALVLILKLGQTFQMDRNKARFVVFEIGGPLAMQTQ